MLDKSDTISVIKTRRAPRRKRKALSPAQIRKAVETLRAGCNTNVRYNADPADMANQAIANMREAIYAAIEILEMKQEK